LHVGNYLGAVKNWVELQHSYDCIFCIVDYHAITVPYEPADLRRRTMDMALSLLAAGLDPEKCTVFVQSHVPEHTELAWIFNTVTPIGELERQTQFKDKAQRQESVRAGLLNYPVLQAADILLYQADVVPVGEDQLQHLELAREIARKWNVRYRDGFFPEPQPHIGSVKKILGLDGEAKMSKSLGNTIGLLDPPARIWELLRPAKTDPARVTRHDPGDPEKCNVYTLHQYFSPPETVREVAGNCRGANWGCLDCKRVLADHLAAAFAPIRERAAELQRDPARVRGILRDGAERARAIASETMRGVRAAMGLLPAGR
jgi:tryptophanyl-tRNA synthetase